MFLNARTECPMNHYSRARAPQSKESRLRVIGHAAICYMRHPYTAHLSYEKLPQSSMNDGGEWSAQKTLVTHTARNSFSWKSNTETVAICWELVLVRRSRKLANRYRQKVRLGLAARFSRHGRPSGIVAIYRTRDGRYRHVSYKR